MTPQRRERLAAQAYDRIQVFRRGLLLGLPFVALALVVGGSSGYPTDLWSRGLLTLLGTGIALALLLALPLAVALARPTDARDPRWSATVAGLPWTVTLAFVLSGLLVTARWRLVFAAIAYAVFVAVVALSALPLPRPEGHGSPRSRSLTLPQVVASAALLLWPIGAAWFVMDAFGIAPLGFSPLVVRLTAIHFHYAAFIVPVIATVVAATYPSALSRTAAVISVLGAPSTAIGITAAQLGAPHWVETLFALPMIAGALLVGAVHLVLALGAEGATSPLPVRVLRLVVGATLLVTMGLAAAYAGRGWLPWAPTIPQMALWHGIGNAVGVALCGLLACWLDPARQARPSGA